jgi:CRP-like cAMP-binding protein
MCIKETIEQLWERLSAANANLETGNLGYIKIYKEGETIYEIGEKPKGLYFIKRGQVKILRQGLNGDGPVLTRIAMANEFIGFVSLIKRGGNTSSAVTISEAEVQLIPKHVFLHLLQTDLDFTKLTIEILCELLYDSEQKIVSLIAKSSRQRLAALLLSLELAFDENSQYDDSNIRQPKKDLAAAVGVTPETISRNLAEFKEKGYLETGDDGIEITDQNALFRLSMLND